MLVYITIAILIFYWRFSSRKKSLLRGRGKLYIGPFFQFNGQCTTCGYLQTSAHNCITLRCCDMVFSNITSYNEYDNNCFLIIKFRSHIQHHHRHDLIVEEQVYPTLDNNKDNFYKMAKRRGLFINPSWVLKKISNSMLFNLVNSRKINNFYCNVCNQILKRRNETPTKHKETCQGIECEVCKTYLPKDFFNDHINFCKE